MHLVNRYAVTLENLHKTKDQVALYLLVQICYVQMPQYYFKEGWVKKDYNIGPPPAPRPFQLKLELPPSSLSNLKNCFPCVNQNLLQMGEQISPIKRVFFETFDNLINLFPASGFNNRNQRYPRGTQRIFEQRILTYFVNASIIVQVKSPFLLFNLAGLLMLNEQHIYLFGQISNQANKRSAAYSDTFPHEVS